MATSNSIDFELNRDEIITDALIEIGAIDAEETPPANEMQHGARRLNMMVKHWANQGIHLWTRTDATLFLVPSQEVYTISATGDHATTSYVQTALNGALATSATVWTVDSTTGMTASDNIAVKLDSGALHWDTIVSVDSATQVTVTTGVSGAASDNAVVFAYTTRLARPVRLLDARWRSSDGREIPIDIIAQREYKELADKAASGKVVQIHYDRQLASGKLYVWPTSDDVSDVVKFTCERALEDFDATVNTPDFPQEWTETLMLNLAVRLARSYGVAVDQDTRNEADRLLAEASSFDQEVGSVFFQPDM